MKLPFDFFVFVMAGGSGERFWPLSRRRTPKHLLRIFSGRTLLEATLERVGGLTDSGRIFVLTNRFQRDAVLAAVPGLEPGQVVAEPSKRDTAPAVALAAGIARSRAPEAVMALVPADHLVNDVEAFRKNIRDAALQAAKFDGLVAVGSTPAFPATGFGYLELGDDLPPGKGGTRFRRVKRFVEKPDLATAKKYMKSGRHAWNAGTFVWKVSSFLAECRRSAPALAGFIEGFPRGRFAGYLAKHFEDLPQISVDYAVMEKARHVIAAQADYDWDDVGAWTSLARHLPADAGGNATRGRVICRDSRENIVFSNGPAVALLGTEGLVVVAAGDAVLVCHRDRVQDIKKLFPALPEDVL